MQPGNLVPVTLRRPSIRVAPVRIVNRPRLHTVDRRCSRLADNSAFAVEFCQEEPPYPSVDAATLVETTSGRLLWFGRTEEGHPDVSIWLACYENGRWPPGVEVADGVQDAAKRNVLAGRWSCRCHATVSTGCTYSRWRARPTDMAMPRGHPDPRRARARASRPQRRGPQDRSLRLPTSRRSRLERSESCQ